MLGIKKNIRVDCAYDLGMFINVRGGMMLVGDSVYNGFVNDFSNRIYNLRSDVPFSDYIFLCVGSDRITGDAFGPLVGDNLKKAFKNFYNNIRVVGTLENPVSGVNLEKTVRRIYDTYKNPCIIAVDAALSGKEDVGKIVVTNSKMKFGKGTNKKMLEVGDVSIKGIVGRDYKVSKYNFRELQNVSLNVVMRLAGITSDGIYNVIKYK